MTRTPNGFRAVRYCDSRHIYYCRELDGGAIESVSDDGDVQTLHDPKTFRVMFCHEHRPEMPPVVRARFEGKPTFAEWWAAQQSQK